MATFYYDHFSTENINSQWTKHLQTNAYIRDIDGIIKMNRRELETTIQNSSSEQVKAIQQVCGKLDDGFAEVSYHLRSINSNISELRGEINEMAAMLDWKLSMLIEEQRLTNQLLIHIEKLLRIPDSQKQRVYFIEQGLKYLKNAMPEGCRSSFYTDALEAFKEAEKIERKDYITLQKIGLIYLYSEKYLNIPLAEEYYLKSAREALAESNAGGTTSSNNFIPSGYENDIFIKSSAEAYLYASRACYLQQKLSEAANYAEKAYHLIPNFIEAGFEQAKYLAANIHENEAVKVLETVITKDRFYAIKTLTDQDLSTKPAILKFLNTLKDTIILKATIQLEESKKNMVEGSKALNIINEITVNISKGSFLSGMKALDLLKADYMLPINKYEFGDDFIKIVENMQNLKLTDFLIMEKDDRNVFEQLNNKVKRQIFNKTIRAHFFYGLLLCWPGFFILGGILERITDINLDTNNTSSYMNLFIVFLVCFIINVGGSVILGLIKARKKEPRIIFSTQ